MSRCQLMYAEPCPYAYPPFPSASSCLKFLPGCVCVSKHVYAFLSSSIFIHTYRHIHMYGLCSVLYIYPPFCFLSFVSKNLIDTYVTVPIDVRTTLLICLSSFSICIFISLIYEPTNKYIRLSVKKSIIAPVTLQIHDMYP